MLTLLFALATTLAPSRPAASEGGWDAIELPAGFHLDLATGAVVSQPRAGEEGTLRFERGRVIATPRLARWTGTSAERIASKVVRAGGAPLDVVKPAPGDEWIFDAGGDVWGYLRVTDLRSGTLWLEYARASGAEDGTLVRRPAGLEAGRDGDRVRLNWLAEDGAQYEIQRAYLTGDSPRFESLETLSGDTWTDPTPTHGVVAEYRVARVDGGRSFGDSLRAIGGHLPGEWPIPVAKGARIDLLTGDSNAVEPDIEITYAQRPSVQLRPASDARLTMLAREQWILPRANSNLYQESIRSLRMEGELAAYLREGIYVRVSLKRDSEGNLQLFRQFDLSGSRVLALAPQLESSAWSATGAAFSFAEAGSTAPDPETLSIVCERELGFETQDWEEVGHSKPGAHELTVPAGGRARPLQRYRFRHVYPWGGRSLPSDPIRLVQLDTTDVQAVESLLDAAFADLVADDFERRVAARGLLGALGDISLPRLREALAADDLELAAAAREILLANETRGDHVELVLRSRAADEGVTGEPPPGLFDPDSSARALALLRAFGSASGDVERQNVRGWTRVMLRADPDPVVGSLADLLLDQAFRAPRRTKALTPALWPQSQRIAPSERDWREYFRLAPRREDVLTAVRGSVDPSDLRIALALLQIAEGLELDADPSGDALDTAELGLRLIDQFRSSADEVLLEAALELMATPTNQLRALNELAAQRFGDFDPDRVLPERRRIELEEPTFAALQIALDGLRGEDGQYTDLVLPPGKYGVTEDRRSTWLDCSIPGVRLIGGDGVVINVGVRVQNAADVVFDGITFDNDQSSALMLHRGSVTLIDCRVSGSDTAISVQEGQIELTDTLILPARGSRPTNWAIRLNGPSILLMRDSRSMAGTISLGPGGLAYAERCVFDTGDRIAIQGNRGGVASLRNCLVRSQAAGMSYLAGGTFDRVVLDVREVLGGPAEERVGFCPQHLSIHNAEAELDSDALLARCPFDSAPR